MRHEGEEVQTRITGKIDFGLSLYLRNHRERERERERERGERQRELIDTHSQLVLNE